LRVKLRSFYLYFFRIVPTHFPISFLKKLEKNNFGGKISLAGKYFLANLLFWRENSFIGSFKQK